MKGFTPVVWEEMFNLWRRLCEAQDPIDPAVQRRRRNDIKSELVWFNGYPKI